MIKSLAKEKLSNRTTQHLINSTIMNEDIKRVSEAKKKYLDSKRSEYLYAYEKQVGSVVDKLVGKHIYMDYADTPTAIKARTNGEKFVKNYIEKQARDLKELEALESFELDEIELYERQNFR